jgi:hypothetical protein
MHPSVQRQIKIGTGTGFPDCGALQDKKRDREQRDARHLLINVLGDGIERRARHEEIHEDDSHRSQGKGNRHAREHYEQCDNTVQDTNGSFAHGVCLFRVKCAATCTSSCNDRFIIPKARSP